MVTGTINLQRELKSKWVKRLDPIHFGKESCSVNHRVFFSCFLDHYLFIFNLNVGMTE